MNLIDHTYFIGELNLPNTNKQDVQDRLNLFITIYQEKFLTALLGYDLYRQFITGLEAPTPDSMWTDLRDGTEYTVGSILHKWQGLRNEITKKSPIANYVYWYWMRNEETVTTASGERKTKTENAVYSSPSFKMVKAWNDMVNQTNACRTFISYSGVYAAYYYNPAVYLSHGTYRGVGSGYGEIFEHINQFGI